MFLSIFSEFILFILGLFVPVWILRFQTFVCLCCVIQILLLHWIIHTCSLYLFPTASLSLRALLLATTDCRAACKRSGLRAIVLLFLDPVEPCTLQTTLQISLRFTVVAAYSPVKIYRFFQRHQFCKRLFLWRAGSLRTRCRDTSSILFTWIILRRLRHSINPFECFLPWFLTLHWILHNLSHLRVQKCVSYDHLFFLQVLLESFASLERQIVKIEREGAQSPITQSLLKLLQLLDESTTDLQVRSTRIQEFECF